MTMADTPAQVALDEKGFTNLREANIARQAAWCPEQIPDLSFRGCELAGEVGEALNVIKKLERERLGWRGSRDTVEHLAEEIADVVICADLVALSAGIDLEAAVVAKFNATSEKVGLPHRLAPRALSSLSGEPGNDGQGALVERLRSPLAISGEHRAEAADRIEALTRENAALRADKERLERERDHWLSEAQRILRSGQDALDKLEAAERRLAEQGQAQGEAVAYADPRSIASLFGAPAKKVYLSKSGSPAYSMPLYATPPSPEPDAELVEALEDLMSWVPEKPSEPEWRFKAGVHGADDAVHHARVTLARHRKQGGAS